MKLHKLLAVLSFLLFNISFAKTITNLEAKKIIPEASRIDLDDKTGTFKFIVINENNLINKNEGYDWFLKVMKRFEPKSEFKLIKNKTDKEGFNCEYLEQFINNYKVEHSIWEITLHREENWFQ